MFSKHDCLTYKEPVYLRATMLALQLLVVGLGLSLGAQPDVKTSLGVIRGLKTRTLTGKLIYSFQGIPYAQPPVGNLRFEPAVTVEPWTGVYNATTLPADCLQFDHVHMNDEFAVHGSEDCLYLNVYTPKRTTGKSLHDVIVYIHGGAFQFHSGSSYGPEILLERDVILVTLNYRLGPLGFLSTEDSVVPGNNGLKDQNLAFKWVRDNIEAFGGNPKKISIAGMSAGGASVHYHVISEQSKGIFTHAILISGTALCPWPQTENSRQKAQTIANHLGCPTGDSAVMIKCLKQRPADKIVGGVKLFMPFLYNPYTPFGPVVEVPSPTAFISKSPIDIIMDKEATDVPLLVTFTADEGLYPGADILGKPENIELLENQWENLLPHVLDYNYTLQENDKAIIARKIRQEYLGKTKINQNRSKFIKMISDRLFNTGIELTARLHASLYSSPVYVQKFSFVPKKSLACLFMPEDEVYKGSSHADDVSFILKSPLFEHESTEENLAMFKLMTDIWTSFVQDTPMPNDWPQIRPNLPQMTFLDITGGDSKGIDIKIRDGISNAEFWNSLNLKENVRKGSTKERSEL